MGNTNHKHGKHLATPGNNLGRTYVEKNMWKTTKSLGNTLGTAMHNLNTNKKIENLGNNLRQHALSQNAVSQNGLIISR